MPVLLDDEEDGEVAGDFSEASDADLPDLLDDDEDGNNGGEAVQLEVGNMDELRDDWNERGLTREDNDRGDVQTHSGEDELCLELLNRGYLERVCDEVHNNGLYAYMEQKKEKCEDIIEILQCDEDYDMDESSVKRVVKEMLGMQTDCVTENAMQRWFDRS